MRTRVPHDTAGTSAFNLSAVEDHFEHRSNMIRHVRKDLVVVLRIYYWGTR